MTSATHIKVLPPSGFVRSAPDHRACPASDRTRAHTGRRLRAGCRTDRAEWQWQREEVNSGGANPGRRYPAGARARGHRRGHRRTRHPAQRRRRQPQGPLPLPRRAFPQLQRHSRARRLPLLRLRRRRRRHHLPHRTRRPHLRGGGRAPRRARRPQAHLRGRRRPGPARPLGPAGPQAAPARRPHRRRRVLHRQAPLARGAHRPPVPHRPRLRPGRGGHVRLRLRPRLVGRPLEAPARQGLHRRGADDRRARQALAHREPHRPVPPPPAVADPRLVGFGDRLRRQETLRRRPGPQVPQHPRDPAVQEVAGPLRHRFGPQGDREDRPGRHRRGLHRCHGLPPRGRPDGGRDLRHGVRSRPHPHPAAVPLRLRVR